MGRTFTYTYAANGIDLTQITETKGTDNFQIGAWTYNSQHRPLTYTDGSGRVTSYAYNSSGELTTLTDANSNVTTNTYTGTCTATIGGTKTTGNVLTITVHDTGLAGGQKAVPYTVLAGDTLTTIATGLKNAINADTSLQAIGVSATSSGTVITLISNSVNVTTYTQSVTGTETITLGVNTFGYRTKIDGPLSGTQDVTTMTYDNVGRLASQTDSEGYTLIFGYDNADRPTLTTYPDATTEQTIYDKLDAVLTKDRIGRWSQSAYDSMDQLAFEIDPLGRKTKYAWCACGSLHSLTDPAGNVTTWQHDLQGRPIVKTYQDQTTITYGYENCTSRLRTQKDALGQTKYFLYNPDNTNFQTGYKGTVNPTSTVTNTYDPAYKRLASVAKNDWGTYTYTYNPYIIPMGTPTTGGGRLQLVHNNVIANSDITYVYDVLGRTTNRSINGATNSITWAYDAMSRVTSEANALGTFTYAYVDDTPGSSKGTTRLASISYPNSQSTNFSWYGNTQDQRLQTIKNTNPSGGLLSQFDYGYDPAGEITQWQQQQNGNNQFYNLAYDNAGQLTTAQVGSGSPLPPYGQEFYYGYDAASNRTSVQSASCQNVRVGGTVTAANTVTITVVNSALSGGQKAITYTVVGGDTLATIASKLAAAIASDSNLQTAGVTAVASSTLITLRSVSPNVTTYTLSTSGGATETLAFAIFKNGVENATIGGTKTTSNVLTITVKDAGLAGGSKAVNYTVLAGDTLTTIASGIASAINADVNLSAIGVTATSAGTVVSITSTSTNPTTYAQSVSNGSTETITLQANTNIPALATVSGTKTTSDVLTITVFDSGLAGGSRAVPYTVLAGDTLTTIATGLKNAINADTNLQGIGVSATSASTVITINSKSPNATTYRATRSATATEVLTLSTQANAFVTAFVGGTKTTGNVLTLTVFDSGLTTGQQAVTYTVLAGDTLTSIATGLAAAVNANTNLQGIGVSATAVNQIVNLQSTSSNLTTYTKSVNAGGTETITLSSGVGVMQAAYNNVNELVGLSPGGDTRFQGVTNKAIKSASVATQVINVSAKPVNQTSYSSSVSGAATETVAFSANINGNTTATIGGTNTTNDVVTITTFNASLTNGQKSDSYTVQPGDTPTLIATGLKNAINADTSLQAIGVSATSSGAVITITVTGTTYTTSTSGGATETLTLGTNVAGNTTVAVGGTVTNGNTVTVTVHSPLLAGGQRAVTYTVQATDTLVTVAQGLANAMTADTNLQALGVSASNSKAATLAFAESFSGNGTLPTGMSTANVTATDAVPTSKTVGHQIGVASPASSTLTYDANGNMLSDGTNTYSWDAENRLTRITYPGVNNFTDFTFDGFGRNVKIVETTAGSVTSTKQFVWCDDENRPYQFCEERDGSGTLNKMFFGRGQQNTGTKYFYTRDQLGIDSTITATLSSMSLVQLINPAPFLGSVREVTDNTGAVQAQYSYDPYGQVTKLQGNQNSDFQFGGYYQHLRSGLNLTLMRIYSSQFGRWMSRDPLGEGLSMQTRSAFAIEAKKAVLTGEINAEALESGLQNLAPSIDNGSATPKAGEQGINLNTYLKNNPVGSIDPDGRQGLWGWGRILILVLAVLAFLCWLYRKLGGWNRIVGRGRDQPNATTTQPLTPRGSQEKAKETGPQFGDDLH
jgi:RHS repeat-associated protein